MRFAAFVAVAVNGKQIPVAAGTSLEPLRAMGVKARAEGLAVVDGEAVPIVGGCVFASDALMSGPVLEFRCLTPDQRKAAEAKAKADAKAAKEKADAEAKVAKKG